MKGLNAFRCFAALGVFVHHVEDLKHYSGFQSIGQFKGIHTLGGNSVTAFFVLSGFLLTYLLMKEKNETQTVHLTYFYQRRLLRIWPLYFFTILLYKGFFIHLPLNIIDTLEQVAQTNAAINPLQISISPIVEWLMFLGFLPHVAMAFGASIFPAHVWSIGVEEFFYLIWPIIILKSNHYPKTFLKVIGGYLVLVVVASGIFLWTRSQDDIGATPKILANFFYSFLFLERISCMAIGALAAYVVLYKKNKYLSLVKSKTIFTLSIILLLIMSYQGFILPILSNELYSLLFAVIILHISQSNHAYLRFTEHKSLVFLGKISYGIYMFNPLTIMLSIEILNNLNTTKKSILLSYPIFYALSFLITLLFSFISYKYLEKPFLRLKKYHQPQQDFNIGATS